MIITISREFGSGGRELGKLLSEELGIAFYDRKIIEEVAKLHDLDPRYVEKVSDADIRTAYPMTIGRSFVFAPLLVDQSVKVHSSRMQVIKKLASQNDCVVAGHGADAVLQDLSPMNLFVYADQQSKLQRCLQRAEKGETETEILRQMRQIDRNRALFWEFVSGGKWGRKENYHLCINTSGKNPKALIPGLSEYVKCWFAMQQK